MAPDVRGLPGMILNTIIDVPMTASTTQTRRRECFTNTDTRLRRYSFKKVLFKVESISDSLPIKRTK
jgi:hypothetical protein